MYVRIDRPEPIRWELEPATRQFFGVLCRRRVNGLRWGDAQDFSLLTTRSRTYVLHARSVQGRKEWASVNRSIGVLCRVGQSTTRFTWHWILGISLVYWLVVLFSYRRTESGNVWVPRWRQDGLHCLFLTTLPLRDSQRRRAPDSRWAPLQIVQRCAPLPHSSVRMLPLSHYSQFGSYMRLIDQY